MPTFDYISKISEMRREKNPMFVKLCLFWLFVCGKKTGENYLTIIRVGRIMDDFYFFFLLFLFPFFFFFILKDFNYLFDKETTISRKAGRGR